MMVRGAAGVRALAVSRRKIHGLPNISIFLRFFKAIDIFGPNFKLLGRQISLKA
jgi:hypothetical protein